MKKNLFMHVAVNLCLVAVVLCISAVGLFTATANVYNPNGSSPIYRGTGKNQVNLMINVYWGTEYLDGFLDIFKKYNVRATFFVGGCWAAQNPDYLNKIVAAGHEIGNHGYFHKEHSKLNYQQNVDEIVTCGKVVFEYVGIQPTLFAPPSGDFSNDTLKAAADNGYKTIMWSRDTIDWRDKDAEVVFTRATKNVAEGELILMHPTQHTLAALERIVQYLLNNNLQPVTVSENIGEQWNFSNSTPAA